MATAIVVVIFVVINGCGKENTDDFVAVSSITGVPTVAETGKPLTLVATVSPEKATNQKIEWTVKNAGTTGANLTSLNVLTATAAGTVTVTATIAGGASKNTPFTSDFAISVKAPDEIPVVTAVTVSPTTASVAKGKKQTFTATVTGNKLSEADKAVYWTVTGGTKQETAITAEGTLTVAEDETAASLTVKATSTVNITKSGTATVTVTAGGGTIQGNTLAEKLLWIKNNAATGATYNLDVNANEGIAPHELSYSGKSNITIQLKGIGNERVVGLSGKGSLFTIGSGVTLILDENITLLGMTEAYTNDAALVRITAGGKLIMNPGAKITGNTNSNSNSCYGGGVHSSGTFIMNGGTIVNNNAYSGIAAFSYGGGVYMDGGTFTMEGGTITGNSARTNSINRGGGVCQTGGTFIMNEGTIENNHVSRISGISGNHIGGGVYVTDFTMNGGTIEGNSATEGGGVFTNGKGVMNGGTIRGNTSINCGGGVVARSFLMTGGIIEGNTARNYGAGVSVYQNGGNFTMSGGTIKSNTIIFPDESMSSEFTGVGGAGVHIYYYGGATFNKTGGTIYGYTAGNSNSNVAKNSLGVVSKVGHAVLAHHGTTSYRKYKDTTSGPENNLSYTATNSSANWSGVWDN